MASGAVIAKEGASAIRQILPDRLLVGGEELIRDPVLVARRQQPDAPVRDTRQPRVVEIVESRTDQCQRRDDVALVEHVGVAVPVHAHADARLLVPDRREVDDARDAIALRRVDELPLVERPGVDATRPEVRQSRRAVQRDEVEVLDLHLAHHVRDHRDEDVAVEQPLHEIQFLVLPAHFFHHGVHHHIAVEALVVEDREHEQEVALDVDAVAGAAEHDLGLLIRCPAQRREVAERAVHADEVQSEDGSLGEADRPFEGGLPFGQALGRVHPGLGHQTEGREALFGVPRCQAPGHDLRRREDFGQHLPEPIRQRCPRQWMIGADRPVLEVRPVVGEVFRYAEAMAPQQVADDHGHRGPDQPGDALARGTRSCSTKRRVRH